VFGNQSESSATHALATASWSPRTSQPSGARSSHTSSNRAKPGIDRAASVRIGPAATRFTRIPRGPRSRARYRAVDSNADLATPIQSYTGHARELSKSRPTTDPPALISGNAATASALSEYADTWSATATSDHGASRNPPPRHD